MYLTRFKIVSASFLGTGFLTVLLGGLPVHAQTVAQVEGRPEARPSPPQQSKGDLSTRNADVQAVLDKFEALRPDAKELAVYQLDWASTLADAKRRAAAEQRPIFLMVVTNSYGDLHSGHC